MPNVAAIRERREQFSFEWGMATWTVQYRAGEAGKLSQDEVDGWNANLEHLRASGDEEQAKQFLAQVVVRLVAWWDAEEGDAMFPLDVAHVATLDPEFNLALLTALLGDISKKKGIATPTPVPSDATSSRAIEGTLSTSSQTDVSQAG